MKTVLVSLLLLLPLFLSASASDANSLQQKESSLKVVSAEFGRFPDGKGPRNLTGKNVVFEKTNRVGSSGYSYGWRLALDSSLKSIKVFEKWDSRGSVGVGTTYSIMDGMVYHDWDVVMGTRKGRHTVELFINKKPIKKFVYFVE